MKTAKHGDTVMTYYLYDGAADEVRILSKMKPLPLSASLALQCARLPEKSGLLGLAMRLAPIIQTICRMHLARPALWQPGNALTQQTSSHSQPNK